MRRGITGAIIIAIILGIGGGKVLYDVGHSYSKSHHIKRYKARKFIKKTKKALYTAAESKAVNTVVSSVIK